MAIKKSFGEGCWSYSTSNNTYRDFNVVKYLSGWFAVEYIETANVYGYGSTDKLRWSEEREQECKLGDFTPIQFHLLAKHVIEQTNKLFGTHYNVPTFDINAIEETYLDVEFNNNQRCVIRKFNIILKETWSNKYKLLRKKEFCGIDYGDYKKEFYIELARVLSEYFEKNNENS